MARSGSTAPDDVVPTVAHTIAGTAPARAIRSDRRLKRVHAHGVALVCLNEPQVRPPQARDLHPLLDGGVSVPGGVDREPRPLRASRAAACAMPVDRTGTRALARGNERGQRAARRAVLDRAAAGRARPVALRQPEQVDQPVEHVGLELGAGRARRPEHALHPEPGREQIAENRGTGGVGREVGVEVRRLPMGNAGEDDLVDVAQQVGEGLAPLGRGARQARTDRSGLGLGEHGILLHLLHVAGDAFDERSSAAAKLVRRHVRSSVHQEALLVDRSGWVATRAP